MDAVIAVIIIWVTAAAGNALMKTVNPDNRVYLIYTITVCILATLIIGSIAAK